jgi:hypothetical protein
MNTLLKSRIFCAPSARENLQKGNLMGASWPELASRQTALWGNFPDIWRQNAQRRAPIWVTMGNKQTSFFQFFQLPEKEH